VKTSAVLFDVGPFVSGTLQKIAANVGSFVARAKVSHANTGPSSDFVLKEDEGRFIWCGYMPEAPPATSSEEAAWSGLEYWAGKDPNVKVERN
jgi:hypothetical protein